MTANDLIKLLDSKYAGNSGQVARNWKPGVDNAPGTVVDKPVNDALAFYLASWVNDRQVEGWFEKGELPEMSALSGVLGELQLAIVDLNELSDFLARLAAADLAIDFFEMLKQDPRPVNQDFWYVWASLHPERILINHCADILMTSIMEELGDKAADPTVEVCDEILTGLREKRDALLGLKQEPDVAAEAPAAPAPESK